MNTPIRAIIIDDEENARKTLSRFITDYCPDVELVAQCKNVPEGAMAINKYNPDVVFLDIEMPEYNGFDLLNFFKVINFEIVFVTAYSEYAIRAFEVSAIDYLLKPVEIESLQKAVEKLKEKKYKNSIQDRLELMKDSFKSEEIKKIALPMSDGLLFVDIEHIVYFEADGAYTSLFLNNGSKLFVSKKIKFFEEILHNRKSFFRSHRSYLININYIKKYLRGESNIVMENETAIPISRERKQEFEDLLVHLKV